MTKKAAGQNGNGQSKPDTGVSKLGQRLREISDRALASGVKTLSREQIQMVVLEARGGPSLK